MIRVFGPPDITHRLSGVSGVFDFEDQNFDVFRVHDVKETDETTSSAQQRRLHPPKNLRNKPMPLPTSAQFWDSAEVMAFKVAASDKADIASFLKWARGMLEKDIDAKAVVIERFGPIEGLHEYKKDYPVDRVFPFFTLNASSWPVKDKSAKEVVKSKKEKAQAKADDAKKAANPSVTSDKKPEKQSPAPDSDTTPAAEPLKTSVSE